MSNPGPATTVTANQQSLTSQQALRLIGVLKGVSLAAAGDTAFNILGGTQNWLPVSIITSNMINTATGATIDAHLSTLGVYTAPAAGGTTVLTTAALTSQTGSTYVKVQAATNATTAIVSAGTLLYANVVTTTASAQCDLFVYGYDLS
jgi:hypothetical protein